MFSYSHILYISWYFWENTRYIFCVTVTVVMNHRLGDFNSRISLSPSPWGEQFEIKVSIRLILFWDLLMCLHMETFKSMCSLCPNLVFCKDRIHFGIGATHMTLFTFKCLQNMLYPNNHVRKTSVRMWQYGF
jgi:hypothetical protein